MWTYYGIMSSQMRVDQPLPSVKGWHTIISAHCSTSDLNLVWTK